MKISDLYREIANNPIYKDTEKLRKVTKQLLNRARVRVQTVENKGARTSRYLAAKERLKNAGLITAGGNVSTKLPHERQNILTTLRHITNFLDIADTTIKGQKRRAREATQRAKKKKALEKKKREKERLKKKKEEQKRKEEKEKKKSLKEKIEDEDNTEEPRKEAPKEEEPKKEEPQEEPEEDEEIEEYEEPEEDERQKATIGDYWKIARETGLIGEYMDYEDFAEYVEDIFDNVPIDEFERIVIDTLENGADFWNEIKSFGVDIDD